MGDRVVEVLLVIRDGRVLRLRVQVSAVLGERLVLREVDRRMGALLRRLSRLEVGKSGRRLGRVAPVRDAPRSGRGFCGGGGDGGVPSASALALATSGSCVVQKLKRQSAPSVDSVMMRMSS